MGWQKPEQNLEALEGLARGYVRNLLVATPLGAQCLRPASGPRVHPLYLEALRLAVPEIAPLAEEDLSEAATGKKARRLLRRRLARWRARAAHRPRWLARNLGVPARETGLDAIETSILAFVLATAARRDLHELATQYYDGIPLRGARSIVAAAIAAPEREVAKRLRPQAPLAATGLVDLGSGIENLASLVSVPDRLVDLLLAERLAPAILHQAFAPRAPAGTLTLADFDHARPAVALLRALLDRSLRARRRGVNVLLFGPTGTGKTELACALARSLRASLHRVGMADDAGDSPTSHERLHALALANRVLCGRARNLLLFDEVEDLLEASPFLRLMGLGTSSARMSKQWFNRLLEENPIPTIWITNDAGSLDAAFRRRFCYAMRFEDPGVALRRRLWGRYTAGYANLADGDLDHLASHYEASPGLIQNAAETAGLVARDRGPSRADIEAVLRPTVELTHGGRLAPRRAASAEPYRLDGLNADIDLECLVERLRRPCEGASGALSLCLHGPPGTGKSAFVRFLAERLGRRLEAKPASQLLSPWVGMTEAAIAQAFEAAARDGAILLFDEVDSFLHARQGAHHSWEVTQVNEFLQQLELHPGIVACTTNRFDDLDPAAARRFVFKIRFDWLRPQQALLLFRELLLPFSGADHSGRDAAEARIARMERLAPGDFAAVRRRLAALGGHHPAPAIADELALELSSKRARPCRPGFELADARGPRPGGRA